LGRCLTIWYERRRESDKRETVTRGLYAYAGKHPPKHTVSIVTGFEKGKSVIHFAGNYKGSGKTIKTYIFIIKDPLCQLWTRKRQQYGNIFENKKRTDGWIN
jgi:hypothetical protein